MQLLGFFLSLISAVIAILGKVIQWIKTAIQFDKTWAEKGYLQQYTKGMALLGSNRKVVGTALLAYYSKSYSPKNGIQVVRYLYPDGETLDLPLITRKEFIRDKDRSIEFCYQYGGEATHFTVEKNVIRKSEENWKAAGLRFRNDSIFSLQNVQLLDTKIMIEFRKTDFFNYRATYGNLYDELALNMIDKGMKRTLQDLQVQKSKLFPLRNKYMSNLTDLLAFQNRICAGGLIVLLAAKTDDNDLALIIERRSATVSDEPLALTPIPRAFHSSEIDPNVDYDLTTSIYREVWEELFGGEEKAGGQINPYYFLEKSPAVKELFEGRGTNNQLIPLGLMWNLYSGNFIASYCLYISDPSWWAKYHRNIEINWESDAKSKRSAVMASQGGLTKLVHTNEWAVDSFFAFLEGLRWLSSNDELASKLANEIPKLVLSNIGST